MNVVLFGATGMLGKGVLLECFDAVDVEHVLAVGRTASGVQHAKLREIRPADLYDLGSVAGELGGYDACFFCLGVSSAGMTEAEYTRVTVDLAVAAAKAVLEKNPNLVFCFVSGQGTDGTEKSRVMWARVKGRAENALLAMPFRGVYCFRPGVVRPERGVTSRTALYRTLYVVLAPLFPVIEWLAPGSVTTTTRLGRAMLEAVRHGAPERVLENRAINALAGSD
jgi:uncharacterized protein YbjT (DUF2867 family)